MRRGVGAANVPHYVAYGAVLRPPPPPPPEEEPPAHDDDDDAAGSRPQQQQQQQEQSRGGGNLNHNHQSNNNNSGNGNGSYNCNNSRLGMTISRIPLGLYVRAVSLDSEAYVAGISPGSVLVSINRTLGMLGERSDGALMRLWTYGLSRER